MAVPTIPGFYPGLEWKVGGERREAERCACGGRAPGRLRSCRPLRPPALASSLRSVCGRAMLARMKVFPGCGPRAVDPRGSSQSPALAVRAVNPGRPGPKRRRLAGVERSLRVWRAKKKKKKKITPKCPGGGWQGAGSPFFPL